MGRVAKHGLELPDEMKPGHRRGPGDFPNAW